MAGPYEPGSLGALQAPPQAPLARLSQAVQRAQEAQKRLSAIRDQLAGPAGPQPATDAALAGEPKASGLIATHAGVLHDVLANIEADIAALERLLP